jgi:hypothetical protein
MKRGLFLIAAVLILLAAQSASAEDKLGNPIYRTSADNIEAVTFSGDWIKGFTNYRVAVSTAGAPTTGSLQVQVSGGIGGFATLQESIDLITPQIMIISGPADSIRFTPLSFDGDSYSVEVLGWR